MRSMADEAIAPIELDRSDIGTMELGDFTVPYVHLGRRPSAHTCLRVGETEYTYNRSFLLKGHSAVMPAAVSELLAEGRRVLVVERDDRLYVYLA